MTELENKLLLFKKESERIDKELSQFLAYSENLTAEMLAGTPEHDYSIDTAKKMSEQFFEIKDKIHAVSEKMRDMKYKIWQIFYDRKQALLNEYLALWNDSTSLPADSATGILTKSAKEKVKELEMHEKLQNCWEEYFGDRH